MYFNTLKVQIPFVKREMDTHSILPLFHCHLGRQVDQVVTLFDNKFKYGRFSPPLLLQKVLTSPSNETFNADVSCTI
jgi:hypothetical protein